MQLKYIYHNQILYIPDDRLVSISGNNWKIVSCYFNNFEINSANEKATYDAQEFINDVQGN